MIEIIEALKDANVPTILTIAGVILILLAIGVEGVIKIPAQRQRHAGISGIILLGIGIGLFVMPRSQPLRPPSQETVQANTPGRLATTAAETVSVPEPVAPVVTSGSPTLPAAEWPEWEVKVEPSIAKHFVGAEHEIYVTVRDLNGVLIVGETVHLQIVDGPHTGLILEGQTNEAGQAVLRYTGNAKGTDIIRVWAGADQYETLPAGMKAEITNDWI